MSSASRRSSGPSPRTTRSSSGSTRRRSTEPTVGSAARIRSSCRAFTGLRRPRRRILGMRACRRGRGSRLRRHRVRGRRPGLRREGGGRTCGVRLHPGKRGARAQAGRHDVRGGCGRLRRGEYRDGLHRPGGSSRGTEHPRLRRVRIDRHCSRAAGQVVRRPRHRGVRHEARRARRVARSRRSRRLPPGGLHEERQDLRRHLRRGGQALVPAVQAFVEAGRDRIHETDLGFMWHVPATGATHPDGRREEGHASDAQVLEAGRLVPEGAHRRRASTAQSSIGRTRSSRWSRRRDTSRPGRRRATSSSSSAAVDRR